MTKDTHKTSGKKGDLPAKSNETQELEEFFDLVGKEHVDPRLKLAKDVRSLVERIKARSKGS